MAGQTIGGGIAGVATKLEEDGIKVYKDQTAYNKWEFVYDVTKDSSRGGGAAVPQQNGAPQNGAQNPGQNTQQNSNQFGTASPGTTTTTTNANPAAPTQ
jgi:hypothetical protein